MSNLLLIGPHFHDFNKYLADAFCQLGWEVSTVAYDTPIHPYSRFNRIRYKLARRKSLLQEKSRMSFSEHAKAVFDKKSPQLVFLLNGEMLTPETVRYFAENSRVLLWLFDSITRLPHCWRIAPLCHKVFCYEKDDVGLIKAKLGVAAEFLPQAVDPSAYCKMTQVEKEWDIVFAADMWKSARRKLLIQSVVSRFPDAKIRVWGIYKPWYKGLREWLLRERRDVYTNRNASTAQLNLDYNKARVVLNIHNEQQTNGANPKVYEIAASGSYQVCDANPYIESLFPNGEIGLYHNEQELAKQIEWALNPANEREREARAERAREIVLSVHTFVDRMRQVLA